MVCLFILYDNIQATYLIFKYTPSPVLSSDLISKRLKLNILLYGQLQDNIIIANQWAESIIVHLLTHTHTGNNNVIPGRLRPMNESICKIGLSPCGPDAHTDPE